jgi:hypothetical protein
MYHKDNPMGEVRSQGIASAHETSTSTLGINTLGTQFGMPQYANHTLPGFASVGSRFNCPNPDFLSIGAQFDIDLCTNKDTPQTKEHGSTTYGSAYSTTDFSSTDASGTLGTATSGLRSQPEDTAIVATSHVFTMYNGGSVENNLLEIGAQFQDEKMIESSLSRGCSGLFDDCNE